MGLYESDVMWSVKHFITKPATTFQAFCLSLRNVRTLDKPEAMLSSRNEVLNHLLELYDTEDVIARKIDNSKLQTVVKYDAKRLRRVLIDKGLETQ